MSNSTPWTPPIGHADIAPTRFERREGDGYLTIDAPWIIPALLRSVEIAGRILEPAAGRGHMSLELRRAALDVVSFDIRRYADRLVDDIGVGDIRALTTLKGFEWVVTNLPYSDLDELAAHLLDLGARDHCAVALLVRAEWNLAGVRQALVHDHPNYAGEVKLTKRPRWVSKAESARASPRHYFSWCVWSAYPRSGDAWERFAGPPPRRLSGSRLSRRPSCHRPGLPPDGAITSAPVGRSSDQHDAAYALSAASNAPRKA